MVNVWRSWLCQWFVLCDSKMFKDRRCEFHDAKWKYLIGGDRLTIVFFNFCALVDLGDLSEKSMADVLVVMMAIVGENVWYTPSDSENVNRSGAGTFVFLCPPIECGKRENFSWLTVSGRKIKWDEMTGEAIIHRLSRWYNITSKSCLWTLDFGVPSHDTHSNV